MLLTQPHMLQRGPNTDLEAKGGAPCAPSPADRHVDSGPHLQNDHG